MTTFFCNVSCLFTLEMYFTNHVSPILASSAQQIGYCNMVLILSLQALNSSVGLR